MEPYDDPATPALRLWRIRQEERGSFEVSGASLPLSDPDGRALEASLQEAYCLWLSDQP
jgi:hypothetical protein